MFFWSGVLLMGDSAGELCGNVLCGMNCGFDLGVEFLGFFIFFMGMVSHHPFVVELADDWAFFSVPT